MAKSKDKKESVLKGDLQADNSNSMEGTLSGPSGFVRGLS